MPASRPRVGVGTVVMHRGRLLLVRRKRPPEAGTWSTPGGMLESGEEVVECSRREVREETGVIIGKPSFLGVTNDLRVGRRHHCVTIWMFARVADTPALSPSPTEVAGLDWFGPARLPSRLFSCFERMLRQDGYLRLPPALLPFARRVRTRVRLRRLP